MTAIDLATAYANAGKALLDLADALTASPDAPQEALPFDDTPQGSQRAGWLSCAWPPLEHPRGGDEQGHRAAVQRLLEVRRAERGWVVLQAEADARMGQGPSRPMSTGINALRSALSTYYDMNEQDLWLYSPHPLLGKSRPDGGITSVAPIDLVDTDDEGRVWALIDQLDSGAVV